MPLTLHCGHPSAPKVPPSAGVEPETYPVGRSRLRPTASTMQPPTQIISCNYIGDNKQVARWSLDNGTHPHPQHGLRLSQDSTARGAVVSWALPCNTGTFCSILSMLYRHQ